MRPGLRPLVIAVICWLFLVAAVPGCRARQGRLLLGGRVVTAPGTAKHGWLDLQNGKIIRIYTEKPELSDVLALDTDVVLFPPDPLLKSHSGCASR